MASITSLQPQALSRLQACPHTSSLVPATSSSFATFSASSRYLSPSLRLNQGVISQSESVSCQHQGLEKKFIAFADFEKASWKPITSNHRKGLIARASDPGIVRAVATSVKEDVKVIAPDAELGTDNKHGDDEERVGVLLLNLGGPDTLEDVQPFLYNLFADPDIIRLPRLFRFLQRPLAQFISTLRAPKSAEGYAAIGGGSPLRQMTDEQAAALKAALESKNLPAKVYVGMRYWHPFTEEAINQVSLRTTVNML